MVVDNIVFSFSLLFFSIFTISLYLFFLVVVAITGGGKDIEARPKSARLKKNQQVNRWDNRLSLLTLVGWCPLNLLAKLAG